MMNLQSALDALNRGRKGFVRSYGEGREDHREAMRRGRTEQMKEVEGTRISQMLGSNRTATLLRELTGTANEAHKKARDSMGLGLDEDRATRTGQILGTLASDITQDRGRELWWLLNAPQAVASVSQEMGLKKFAPDLFKTKQVVDSNGNAVRTFNKALEMGLVDEKGGTKKGISRGEGGIYQQRLHEPGHVDSLLIPSGIAINSGLGLLNFFGGAEGYKAALPSEEDPTKTSNVLGEVAAKYVLGRTGNLLNWEDFKKVRPDVSKDEYMKYKGFKFDNRMDFDPRDGDLSVLPMGVLKYTNEGIHGPEVQFLGRSLPLATAILPTAGALAGTTYGAARGGVRGGLIGGLSSLVASKIAGNVIEDERRRRNKAENERDQIGTIGM